MAGDISVGFTLAVSVGAPDTYDAVGFGAKVYTEITDVENIPDFGGTAQVPTFIPLKTGVVDKAKGSIDYGEFTAPLRRVLSDSGQDLLQDCFDGANRNSIVSVRLYHSTAGTLYFTAIVSSFTYNIADANAWTRNSVTFAIKNKPVPVEAVWFVSFLAGEHGKIVGVVEQIIPDGGNSDWVYAAADSGYVFDQWSDSEVDNPRRLENVSADTTLTATFIVDE